MRIHYATLGSPHRAEDGQIDNAVLVLHWTGASGRALLTPAYMQALFDPGRPLDAARYFLIFADSVGHGRSSKPSAWTQAYQLLRLMIDGRDNRPQIQVSGISEPDTDRRLAAAKQVARIEQSVPRRECETGTELLRSVLWHKASLSQVAGYRSGDQADIKYLNRKLRECLDVTAVQLGLRVESGRPVRRQRDGFDRLASRLDAYADNPALYAAVHRAKRHGRL